MAIYNETTMNILSYKSKTIQGTYYQPVEKKIRTVLLYFHGGGFVFGSRLDLPKSYIEYFTSQGISLLAVDYPLSPETKLDKVLKMTNQLTKWFVDEFLPSQNQSAYFIIGRSAGAFIALSNSLYTNQLDNQPLGVISLYGYYKLNDASFTVPNRHYLKYPKVSEKKVATQLQEEPLFHSQDQNRYLIYLAARQKGKWLNMVLDEPKLIKELSIQNNQLKELPPLFLASATKDPDVPSRQSRQLAKSHSNTRLHLVDLEEHDFDRTHEKTLGIELYQKIIRWIFELL